MRPETRDAMRMLFAAKWNVPQAAVHCGLSEKEVKNAFKEYCNINGPTYLKFDNSIQLTFDYDNS